MAAGDQCAAFANRGKVLIAGVGGTPASFAFAVVKDVELTVSAEHVPLYGWGSIYRAYVAKHTEKVSVKVGSMKFNPAATGASSAWWSYVTNPSGAASKVSGANEDTTIVKLFNIDAYFTFEDGQILHGVVYNVYFPSIPFRASEGQWVKLDVTGEGSSVDWLAS
jgi:hypothetical protein